jgi:hypothetical protein
MGAGQAKWILKGGEKDAKAISRENGLGISGLTGFGVGIISTRASE